CLSSAPASGGTLHAQNSVHSAALGPAIEDVRASPILPALSSPVTIQALVSDPDGINSVTLHYAIDGMTGRETQAAMTNQANWGRVLYSVTIPPKGLSAENNLVKFYILAIDGKGHSRRF